MRAIASLVLAGAGAIASAQVDIQIGITGTNATDPLRGLDNAKPGDEIEITLAIDHNAYSAVGAVFRLLGSGVAKDAWLLQEDGVNASLPWSIGRNPIYFSSFSDRPPRSPNPGNFIYEPIEASLTPFGDRADTVLATRQTLSLPNGPEMAIAATPPGAGGATAFFPILSGDPSLVFRIVYSGGVNKITLLADTVGAFETSSSIGAVVFRDNEIQYSQQIVRVVPGAPTFMACIAGISLMSRRSRRRVAVPRPING